MQISLFNFASSPPLPVLIFFLRNICIGLNKKKKGGGRNKSGLSFGYCLIDGRDSVCLPLGNGGWWWKTRACCRKNCMRWVLDVFFVQSHLITVATVIEYNKTENPINSPPGAVMVSVLPEWTPIRISSGWKLLHFLNIFPWWQEMLALFP